MSMSHETWLPVLLLGLWTSVTIKPPGEVPLVGPVQMSSLVWSGGRTDQAQHLPPTRPGAARPQAGLDTT